LNKQTLIFIALLELLTSKEYKITLIDLDCKKPSLN